MVCCQPLWAAYWDARSNIPLACLDKAQQVVRQGAKFRGAIAGGDREHTLK